jgi:adenylate cyclase
MARMARQYREVGRAMGMKDDISGRLKEVLAPGDYAIQDSETIPGPGDNRVTFANTGVRFWTATLYIDMRGSTAVLNQHQAHAVGKLHKAYLYTATTLIAQGGGQIRSYNGDSILAFFPGNTKAAITSAIKAAMQVKYMLVTVCKEEFQRYQMLNFGAGVDHGQILCVKAGRGQNDNHNDFVWLGNAVNRATVLSDSATEPSYVFISERCRTNLENSAQFCDGKDMWTEDAIEYNGARERAWKTGYGWRVD